MSEHDAEQQHMARVLCERFLQTIGLTTKPHAVIAIAGESGSGKTATALALAKELGESAIRATILHQDDYFFRPPRSNHAHRERDLSSVGPQEVNIELVGQHVRAFRARSAAVTVPRVDYAADAFRSEKISFQDTDVLIVEGTYLLLSVDAEFRIFLAATHEDTRDRRRARGRDAESEFVERVLAIEHALIAPQRAVADIVIDRAFHISSNF